MPHNFRLTGTRYVSKASVANDSNTGTDPNLPKKTIAGGLSGLVAGGTLVVGTGVYKEAISAGTFIHGDGLVVFNGNGFNTFSYSANSSANGIKNIIFKNYLEVLRNVGGNDFYENCIFLCPYRSSQQFYIPHFLRCIFIENVSCDFTTSSSSAGLATVTKNIFMKNANLIGGMPITNNFFNQNLICAQTNHSIFRNNNIRGAIQFLEGGTRYVIRDQFPLSSTPQDHGYPVGAVWATGTAIRAELGSDTRGTAAQWDTAIATCINRDPLFNDASKLDFSLKAASPHIGRATDSTNIGGTVYKKAYYVTSLSNIQTQSATGTENVLITSDSNLQFVGSDIDINTGSDGYIETDWILYSPLFLPTEIGIIDYIGNLNFNLDQAAGSGENENVPDFDIWGNGTAGENPDRLTFEMLWHNQVTQPANTSLADNGGIAPTGVWQLFEWNFKPEIDGAGVTSGNPTFNTATKTGITVRWIKIRIRLRNNYL